MPIYHQPPTAIPASMGEVRPTQTVWTGDSWDYVVDVSAEDARPGTVTIVRRTPAGHCFTTSYRRGRATAVRIPADHYSTAHGRPGHAPRPRITAA
ncbi:hypothetical protein [Actinomadura violacea]|uniref:Uncharacterized protein n=1 Tax=Actinomadura violacea TaxID=2819934 RepID=A0ABS3S7J5_9ACTN|nr:hypothetical protein [Actinomadura violacea]MBO2464972.1 hypothetical protein [Actinomadura violacea]